MTCIALHEEPSHERSLEELEDEIATLSATIQAATYRLLCLVEEYDRRGGWADPLDKRGFRSVAHWLCWRVGLSLPTARQQVAVARKLPEMPKVAAAFSAGEISYSKVRAISRVVNAENEEWLLDLARVGTASHLEKVVRRYRRSRGAAETEQAQEQEASRFLTTYWDPGGMLVVRGRLPPEQGALLLKALDTAKDELLRAGSSTGPGDVSAETSPATATSRAEGSEGAAGATKATLPCACHSEADERHRATSAVARSTAGASPEEASALSLRTTSTRAKDGSAGGRREMCGGDGTTGNQVLADALARVAEQALAQRAGKDHAADRFQVVVHVDSEVLTDPGADGRCDLEGGPSLAPETLRRLACDGTLRPLSHGPHGELAAGRKTRVVGAALRRALLARDGTRCAFPGCTCRARDAHHMEHWADGGETVLSNLAGLCRAHHVFVHEMGYRMEPRPEGGFRFLGPEGREVLESPPLPAVTGDAARVLAERYLSPRVHITPSTGRPTWQGEQLDYDMAVETLWMYSSDDTPTSTSAG